MLFEILMLDIVRSSDWSYIRGVRLISGVYIRSFGKFDKTRSIQLLKSKAQPSIIYLVTFLDP